MSMGQPFRFLFCAKSGVFLPVRVLSRLFRRLYLEKLSQAYQSNSLMFFGSNEPLKGEVLLVKWQL